MAEELGTTRSRDSAVLNGPHAAAVIAVVVVTYWASVFLDGTLPTAPVLQPLTGSILVFFLPGALLLGLLEIDVGTPGRFVLYAVGSSVAIASLSLTIAGIVLSVLGLQLPMAVGPLAAAASILVAGMAALVPFRDAAFPYPDVEVRWLPAVTGLLVVLPIVSIVAAEAMNRWESSLGMYVAVGLVMLVVLLSATRFVPEPLYPLTVFAISLSVLLHRNLLTAHVIGADIQYLYAATRHVAEVGSWSPEMVGVSAAIPVVTAVPAAVSTVTGLGVAMTFKLLYVFVFALVPLGVYYVARDVFDPDVALFGALFFQFYHISFIFTPGKQLVSELFVVLLLLTLPSDLTAWKRGLLVALFSVGLVHSHYGMTYAFGVAALVAGVGLVVARYAFGRLEHDASVGYPLLLLAGGTAWYAHASDEIVERVVTIPAGLFDQVLVVLLTGTIEGSGASYVGGQTGTLDVLQLGLYLLLTGLLAVGLVTRTSAQLWTAHRGWNPDAVEHTALAIPLFVLLVASYVFVLSLWADRVYQLVLPVLAPFAAFGYREVWMGLSRAYRRLAGGARSHSSPRPAWILLAVLLVAILAVNSGMAGAATGRPESATFDPDANDLAFSDDERAGVRWLERQDDIHRIDPTDGATGPDASAPAGDRVRIYTDANSYHLFRAMLAAEFYNVDVVTIKSRWHPRFDRSRIGDGYVFVRKSSLTAAPDDGQLPPASISRESFRTIDASATVVYENEDVVIYRTDGSPRR